MPLFRCRPLWLSVLGPLLPLNFRFADSGRRGNGASGQAAALDWSGLRFAPTALRCSVSRPRRGTHFASAVVHCAQTTATSQLTKRAARGATSPVLLGAPEALRVLPGRAFADALVFAGPNPSCSARRAVPGGGDFCGDEKHRPGVGARSALRQLTRRSCPNVESAANAVSSATRPRAEHRSGVGAQRRPPRHEPLPGTARRAAQKPREGGRRATAATGRKQIFAGQCSTCHASRDARWSH